MQSYSVVMSTSPSTTAIGFPVLGVMIQWAAVMMCFLETRAPPHQVFSGLLSFPGYRSRAVQGQAPGLGTSSPLATLVAPSNTFPHLWGLKLVSKLANSLQEFCCVTFSFLQQIFALLWSLNPQRLSLSIWRVSWLWIPAPCSLSHQSWQLSNATQSSPSSQSRPASVRLATNPTMRLGRTNKTRMRCGSMVSQYLVSACQVSNKGNRLGEFFLSRVSLHQNWTTNWATQLYKRDSTSADVFMNRPPRKGFSQFRWFHGLSSRTTGSVKTPSLEVCSYKTPAQPTPVYFLKYQTERSPAILNENFSWHNLSRKSLLIDPT